jgi:ABC-type polysaccharide/polyol phosphate export permease
VLPAVAGASELFVYRDLIATLVARDLKVRYRRSAIGFLWTMLQPLLTMLVLTIVFSTLFRFDLPNYPVYALAGIVFWNFFSQGISSSMGSLRRNAPLFTKVPVPKVVFPIATVIAGVVNLVLALIPLTGILLATGHPVRPAILFLPLAIVLVALFTLGIGLLLSPLAVLFHDITELIGVLLTVMMYLTPIFYPIGIVPDRYIWLVRLNPVRAILEVFRTPVYEGTVPDLVHLGAAGAITLVALTAGVLAFRRNADRIPFYV